MLIPDGNVGAGASRTPRIRNSLAASMPTARFEKSRRLGGEALSGGSMTAFELACDNAVNDVPQGARLISYGCGGAYSLSWRRLRVRPPRSE